MRSNFQFFVLIWYTAHSGQAVRQVVIEKLLQLLIQGNYLKQLWMSSHRWQVTRVGLWTKVGFHWNAHIIRYHAFLLGIELCNKIPNIMRISVKTDFSYWWEFISMNANCMATEEESWWTWCDDVKLSAITKGAAFLHQMHFLHRMQLLHLLRRRKASQHVFQLFFACDSFEYASLPPPVLRSSGS